MPVAASTGACASTALAIATRRVAGSSCTINGFSCAVVYKTLRSGDTTSIRLLVLAVGAEDSAYVPTAGLGRVLPR